LEIAEERGKEKRKVFTFGRRFSSTPHNYALHNTIVKKGKIIEYVSIYHTIIAYDWEPHQIVQFQK